MINLRTGVKYLHRRTIIMYRNLYRDVSSSVKTFLLKCCNDNTILKTFNRHTKEVNYDIQMCAQEFTRLTKRIV